jgi:photosystem II stability/assembly factor-like uncharacterized protein
MSNLASRPLLSILFAVFTLLVSSRPLSASGAWRPVGPYGGTIHSLALQPGDPDVLYAGSVIGVFKTVDRGAHWMPVGEPFGPVFDLAVDPVRPSTVYAATYGTVRRSPDGGATWISTSDVTGNTTALAIADDGTVYVAAEGSGVFVSLDGGATWQPRSHGLPEHLFPTALAIDPSRPETLYLGLQFGGVYKTENGGVLWSKVGAAPLGLTLISDLEVAPSDGRIVYAATTGGVFGVFRSQDGGITWTQLPAPQEVWSLAVDPLQPDLIWAGTRSGVLRSPDGGATWETTASPADFVKKLVVDPRSGTLWAGTTGVSGSGGVFRSADAGERWSFRSTGLNAAHVSALAITRQAQPRLYASLGYVILRSRNHLQTWKLLPLRAGLIRDLEVDPTDLSTVYALGDGGLFKSTDQGKTWQALWSFHSHGPRSLRVDPSFADRLYVALQGLFKSIDGGRSWFRLKLPVSPVFVDPFEIAPSSRRTLYALAWTQPVPGDPLQSHLLRSRDRGRSWVGIDPGAQVQTFAVDPQDARTLYAFTDQGIFRTGAGGDRWTLINDELRFVQPSNPPSLIAVPGTPTVLYLAYNRNVLKSIDRGVTWLPMNDGLPEGYETGVLTPDLRTGRLYLNLFSHGLWVFEEGVRVR